MQYWLGLSYSEEHAASSVPAELAVASMVLTIGRRGRERSETGTQGGMMVRCGEISIRELADEGWGEADAVSVSVLSGGMTTAEEARARAAWALSLDWYSC